MLKRICCHALTLLSLVFMLHGAALAQAEKRAAHSILIDNTGSLRTQFAEVQAIGQGTVRRLHKSGPISLFNFMTTGSPKNSIAQAMPGVEWSEDESALDRYIEDLYVVAGQTTLLDAINAMAERLNAKAAAEKDAYAAKNIILITDGENRTSQIKEKQLIKALKESGIRVYAVGLVQELDDEPSIMLGKSKKGAAIDFLKRITKETGGRVVFPKGKQHREALLDELCAGLAH